MKLLSKIRSLSTNRSRLTNLSEVVLIITCHQLELYPNQHYAVDQLWIMFLRQTWTINNMVHKVFVYGTLKRNEPNHGTMTNPENGVATFIAEGMTKEKYPLIIATKYNVPFLLHSPGTGYNVKGEIYEVDDKMLSNLDILEDHPNCYIRDKNDIVLTDSTHRTVMKCWVYFLKMFKPELLSKPFLEDYKSEGDHGMRYCESQDEYCTDEDMNEIIENVN
ncbi:putative gamma-glutamylcyclotransferase CG2811 isoform X2 [Bombyx mori]|uniref:Gamma-glutamylcyclotransferase family protein n=2 Tax=Bombyx mori TaxID=7091 RepID=A0A8R2AL96_BOMMO|nr:putative gamma-glutamylcyclotransferase CG2811 isoform X2 [Bombyx mori]